MTMVDNAEQEDDQFDEWKTVVIKKRWCHKTGNSPEAKFKTVEIFVSVSKNGFGTSSRIQKVCISKHL